MSVDERKDRVEIVTAGGLVVAGAAALPAAVLPGLIGTAFRHFHDRRVARWSNLLLDGAISPEEMVSKIEAGLASEDEHVVAGVIGGARAAVSAVELSAIAVIAVLSRRFLQQRDLPRWFYRGALEVLERVDAIELGTLRRLFNEIASIRSDSCTVIGDLTAEKGWRAFQTSVTDPFVRITPFDRPTRLFGYLKRAGLGNDSGGYGVGGSPNVIVVDRETMDWLRTALVEGLG